MERGALYRSQNKNDLLSLIKECRDAGVPVYHRYEAWAEKCPNDRICVFFSSGELHGDSDARGPSLPREEFLRQLIMEHGSEQAKAKLRNEDDDMIRVVDTVELLEEEANGSGRRYLGGTRMVVREHQGVQVKGTVDGVTCSFPVTNLKKVKAATPVSGNKNNNANDELPGTLGPEGHGQGKGEAIRSGRIAGRIAVGSEPAGNALSARIGKGRIGRAEVGFEPLRSGHL